MTWYYFKLAALNSTSDGMTSLQDFCCSVGKERRGRKKELETYKKNKK